MTNKTFLKGIFLLIILLAMPATAICGNNTKNHNDKILLSLKIAKVSKNRQKTEFYKSMVRQDKLKKSSFTGSSRSTQQ